MPSSGDLLVEGAARVRFAATTETGCDEERTLECTTLLICAPAATASSMASTSPSWEQQREPGKWEREHLRGSTSAANQRFRSKTPRSMLACSLEGCDAFDIVALRRVLCLGFVGRDDFGSRGCFDSLRENAPPRNRKDLQNSKVFG